MAPRNTYEIFSQPITKNEHSSASTWKDFDRLRTRTWDDFTRNFGTIQFTAGNDMFCPIRLGHYWNFGPTYRHNTAAADQVKIRNEEYLFEIVINTKGYQKEDIKISTLGESLKVEGRHMEESCDGNKCVSKKFSQSYNLPPNCDIERMRSSILNDDQLAITIPKKTLNLEHLTVRQIPIELTNRNDLVKTQNTSTSNQEEENQPKKGELFNCDYKTELLPNSSAPPTKPKEETTPPAADNISGKYNRRMSKKIDISFCSGGR